MPELIIFLTLCFWVLKSLDFLSPCSKMADYIFYNFRSTENMFENYEWSDSLSETQVSSDKSRKTDLNWAQGKIQQLEGLESSEKSTINSCLIHSSWSEFGKQILKLQSVIRGVLLLNLRQRWLAIVTLLWMMWVSSVQGMPEMRDLATATCGGYVHKARFLSSFDHFLHPLRNRLNFYNFEIF